MIIATICKVSMVFVDCALKFIIWEWVFAFRIEQYKNLLFRFMKGPNIAQVLTNKSYSSCNLHVLRLEYNFRWLQEKLVVKMWLHMCKYQSPSRYKTNMLHIALPSHFDMRILLRIFRRCSEYPELAMHFWFWISCFRIVMPFLDLLSRDTPLDFPKIVWLHKKTKIQTLLHVCTDSWTYIRNAWISDPELKPDFSWSKLQQSLVDFRNPTRKPRMSEAWKPQRHV